MNLGIFLSAGESLTGLDKAGQKELFVNFYLKAFSKEFEKIYIFSYANELVSDLPNNVVLVPNKAGLHRFIYQFYLPFAHLKQIKDCQVFRAYHLSGVVPAIITTVFFKKPFIFNYAYDYVRFSLLEGKFIQAIFFKLVEPLAIRFSQKIFGANKKIMSKLPLKKTIYLPNGVDINTFKPIKKSSNQTPVLLSVGRLSEQKNYKNLIKALAGLDLRLKIVGNGFLKSELTNLARENNMSLEITDRISHTNMPMVYKSADLFVLPSLIEGHPKVLLEAMSCGLPVIASNVEGNNEIVKNNKNGILCNTDVESIKKSVIDALQDQKRMNMLATNARKTIEEHFNLEKLLRIEISTMKSLK